MPRRELLTPTEQIQLFGFPEDESKLIRLATRRPRCRAPRSFGRQQQQPLLVPAAAGSAERQCGALPFGSLRAVRALDLPADLGRDVHQNRLLRLAREGAQTAVFQLQEYDPLRRCATLVAILLETTATLTDETLDLHDRLIGTFFSKVRGKYDREFAADGRALNDKARLYAKICSAVIAAKEAKTDPFAAIEEIIPWKEFTDSVSQAEKLSRDEAFDPLTLLTDYFSTLRKYAPSFLEAFQFRGPPVAQSLLDAIDLLRTMNQSGARKVPATAPMGFVPPRWARSVGGGEEIDRHFYEFCALSKLKNRLRAGDLHVVGSRQFRDFEDYLMPAARLPPCEPLIAWASRCRLPPTDISPND